MRVMYQMKALEKVTLKSLVSLPKFKKRESSSVKNQNKTWSLNGHCTQSVELGGDIGYYGKVLRRFARWMGVPQEKKTTCWTPIQYTIALNKSILKYEYKLHLILSPFAMSFVLA